MMEITRKSRVRIAFLIVLSLLLLSFSACGIQETDVSPTEDPRVAQLQSQLEEAQAQIEKLTEENETLKSKAQNSEHLAAAAQAMAVNDAEGAARELEQVNSELLSETEAALLASIEAFAGGQQ